MKWSSDYVHFAFGGGYCTYVIVITENCCRPRRPPSRRAIAARSQAEANVSAPLLWSGGVPCLQMWTALLCSLLPTYCPIVYIHSIITNCFDGACVNCCGDWWAPYSCHTVSLCNKTGIVSRLYPGNCEWQFVIAEWRSAGSEVFLLHFICEGGTPFVCIVALHYRERILCN